MNFKAIDIISRMTDISNKKYLEDPNFSDKRKNWSFFVSKSILRKVKEAGKKQLGISSPVRDDIEIFGYKVFGVNDLNDDIIYFAEKYKIKED